MASPSILVVEDDPSVRSFLKRLLDKEGYRTDVATDGAEALRNLASSEYDAVLLDLHLPSTDGMEILRAARQQDPDLVVIILTGYGTLESVVEALHLGAFDYLLKPLAPGVVQERIREGLLRRHHIVRRRALLSQIEHLRRELDTIDSQDGPIIPPESSQRFLRSGNLLIDTHHRSAMMGDSLLDLTTTEYNILLLLVIAAPAALTARQLATSAMGYALSDVQARDIVKWHIYHLRKKLELDPKRPQCIKNVRYRGYLWVGS